MFRSGKEARDKEKLASLLILKGKIQKEPVQLRDRVPSDGLAWMEQKMDDILFRLRELEKKVDHTRRERINEFLEWQKFSHRGLQENGESMRTLKVKSMIQALLGEHGKLTSSELSRIIKLSRTRCNEYLIELERAEVVEGTTVRRKKFYQLKKK